MPACPCRPPPLTPSPPAPAIPARPQNLRLAIAGTIALSGNLIDALDALFNARIPAFWLPKSWEAATLGNWFAGMLQVSIAGRMPIVFYRRGGV